MFPPLCQRIKIQLRDNDTVNTIIATHFVDLKAISNDGEKGKDIGKLKPRKQNHLTNKGLNKNHYFLL